MNALLLFKSLVVVTLAGLSACSSSSGQQLRPVAAFQLVKARGALNVYLRQGANTEVKVEAAPEVLESVKTEVRGGTLMIYRDDKFSLRDLLGNKDVKVYVTSPQLTGIEVSGASDVVGETSITAESFRIQASGASDVTLTLNATSLTAKVSGASDVKLNGSVERQQVELSGASDYNATNLKSHKANIQASGASDAQVFADEELAANTSGSSDVHNKGKARLTR